MRKKKIVSVNPQKKYCPIVGIGGSAGGLDAFEELLKSISDEPGMALVFILHLAPNHKSLLTELLARVTKMPVSEITNGMIPEINHVYIKPPNTNLFVAGGKLILSERGDRNLKHMPIDSFFRSLAEELGNRSIGVIMSGTATDGTLGAEAIKAVGGIIFAQDEKSAAYDDMPQSAIAAGCADFVLSPKEVASELQRISKHPFMSSAAPAKTDKPLAMEDKGMESIFYILRRATGMDFTHYKAATVSRRVSRRIVLAKQVNLRNYIKFLREDKNEVNRLYEDLLINVTSFFRDEKVFYTLEKKVIPAVLKSKTKDQSVRIWVPGCSSGEEAYSIAMLFVEALGRRAGEVPVQIFATDMSDDGIDKARRGVYGTGIKNNVGPTRLKRFFTKEGNNYKISKSLREMCVFSKQNVFVDPPFSNIDLISCRNVLIYLQSVLQKKIFHNFHYSLRPGGFLALGSSESAVGYSKLFKDLDRKHKIFVKKYIPIRPELELGQRYYPLKKLEVEGKADIKIGKETDIVGIANKIVLNEYAPCGVLIDSNMEVVQFRGHTGRFLESAAGKPSLDIFKLAREELLMPLRSAIYKARETKHVVKREANNVLYSGRKMSVSITVIPVKSAAIKEGFFLVFFDEIGRPAGFENLPRGLGKISLKGRSVKKDSYIKDLEKELTETKEYLQTVIEEQESVNEEVKTANEEILSSNEELQSTNEELETAKEELQSSNEELTTTNEELQNRNAEVSLLNNDLINLLGSINIPVIMLGIDLVIHRVTPQAEKTLNVASSDIGRPISKVKLNIDIPDFEKILSDVIESLHPKAFEIKDKEENWYSVYIRPYRTMDNKIDGVVALFVDITERKKAEHGMHLLAAIVESSDDAIIGKDLNNIITSWNKGAQRLYGYTEKEVLGKNISIVVPEECADEPHTILERIKNGRPMEHFETLRRKKDGTKFPVSLTLSPIKDAGGRIIGASTISRDITERKKIEEVLAKAAKVKSDFTSMVSHELRTPLAALKESISLVLEGLEGEINEKQKEILSIADKNLVRLSKFINRVLDFQKLEIGKMEFRIQDNDINALIREIKTLMAPLAQKKGLDFILELNENLPKIKFDRDRITDVLLNLVSNSVKFTEKGSITVTTNHQGNFIEVSVKDTGLGIKEEDMKRLFRQYEQLERKVGGTGLGLAIAQQIIIAHGGKIWAESTLEQGTTIHFVLPIQEHRGRYA